MVDYIGTARLRDLLSRIGIGRFIEELAGEIAADYRRWDQFEKSPRHACHSSVGVIELMPTSDGRLYSFKYVNGHPKNTAKELLTVTAFGVLADVATGYPLLLSEMTFVTALRTAAMSALAAGRMARPASRVMAVIGNGAQSEFQAIAFHRMLGVRNLRLYDTDPHATAKLMGNLAMMRLADLTITRCASAAEAVRGADIVTTATADKCNATILTPEMITPGMHLNAVGGDCPGKTELHTDILRAKDLRIAVEFEPQARIEGEIQQLDAATPVIEIADILRGRQPGRASDREVTLFDSVGFALNDFSSLRYLQRLNAEQPDGGQRIDLIPELDDPKDLYAGLANEAMRVPARRRKVA
ncbi:MAG TPA: ornithine cyclodeaminase [Steroidobacteraceae bacterium]|jgi:ornithine cyclodeaminase|nr:ornithine cyclodeaminase [Steroidobacteraceae bacterium]